MIVNLIHSKTTKTLALTLLTTGVAIAITNSPAHAGCVSQDDYGRAQKKVSDLNQNERQYGRPEKYEYAGDPACLEFKTKEEAIGLAILLAPYINSSNGLTDFGIRPNIPLGPNIRIRAGLSFKAIDGALTYSLSDRKSTFNPFVGVGLGSKSIPQITGNGDTSAFSLFGTAGVDLSINRNLSITGAVVLPANSVYGTELQVGLNFFGGMWD